MTLLFYPDAGDWVGRIRLGPKGFSFTEAAESGTFAMSQVQVDDPDADLTIVGHHAFRAVETACSWATLFRGYFADRTVKRGDDGSLRTGVARVWDCTVIDANAVLQFEVIQGTGGAAKRPKETDTQRIAWLLGSTFKGPLSSSDTDVLGYDIDLDKADYRGQTAADVLADCASASGANYWAAWDDAAAEYRLHYYRPERAYNSSTLRISNVLSDVDGVTTFAPSYDARLARDPSRIFSGVYFGYGEKDSYVFADSATVLAAIGHKRETNETDASVRTAAKATAKANRYLAEAATDLDTITVTLHKVPPSKVNLIRAGQRIECKFTHLPDVTAFTWLRVTRRTVAQDGDTQEFYRVDLELAHPKQLGARVRHKPVPTEPDVVDGASVGLTRYAFKAQEGRDDGIGGIEDAYSFGVAPPGATQVESACRQFSPYTQVGCPFGEVGYSGVDTIEQWWQITGTPSASADGLRFTYTTSTPEGVAGNPWPLVYGIAHAAPSRPGQFDALGACSVGGGSLIIPAGVLTGTDYIVLGPGWEAGSGDNVCSGTYGGGEPIDSGAFMSGSVTISAGAAVEVTMEGSGLSLWRSVDGTPDGTTTTFTLPGWNGKGVPRIRIGPLQYAAGTDYTFDGDAGTITFLSAPWSGADITGRWYT